MHLTLVNTVSALAISLIIYCMAVVKSSRVKALVYSLPIPITIALIATGGKVDSSNIIGLLLLCLFLWLVRLLYVYKLPLLAADVTSAVLYVVVGFALIKGISLSFGVVCLAYTVLWLVFVLIYRPSKEVQREAPQKIKPVPKAVIVFALALVLLTLKSYLAGVVVTFPFSGVFAVVEGKNILKTLAAVFSRNSLAILIFFITFYSIHSKTGLWPALLLGWVVYAIALSVITKVIPYQT